MCSYVCICKFVSTVRVVDMTATRCNTMQHTATHMK